MKKRYGFTLIELLVVIAIVAILIAVIVPALKTAKIQAQATVCLSNVNGLTKSWMLYAQENDDLLVGTMVGNTKQPDFCWVAAPQDASGTTVSSGNSTVDDEIRGIRKGLLFDYVNDPKAYHCPSDRRFLYPPESGGTGDGGYRSYSLVAGAGPCRQSEVDWNGYEPYTKLTRIPSPGDKYIMVEESDGRGMNVNSWVIKPQEAHHWVDPIAIWHIDRGILGFADGHGEKHRWTNQSTIDMAEEQRTYQEPYTGEDRADLDYMLRNFPYEKLL